MPPVPAKRSVAAFQSQGSVGRVLPFFFAFMVVVIALQWKETKYALNRDRLSSLALLARFGLVGGIDLVGSLLQQLADQGVGRLENGGAHQAFELLHSYSVGGRGLKTSHQLLDFLVLGEKEFGRGLFFLILRLAPPGFSG